MQIFIVAILQKRPNGLTKTAISVTMNSVFIIKKGGDRSENFIGQNTRSVGIGSSRHAHRFFDEFHPVCELYNRGSSDLPCSVPFFGDRHRAF